MTLDPTALETQLEILEDIERATLRLVVQAVYDFRDQAREIFFREQDLVADIGEDPTREALDRMGVSIIPVRLFGKMDYKRARYVFHPTYSVRQALFVDSKAEQISGAGTATIQTAQTSMKIRQMRRGEQMEVAGSLPPTFEIAGDRFLTTTIFVKYNYRDDTQARNELVSVTLACLPNGMLQEKYNPDSQDTIWLVGRNAPTRGEPFRVRIAFAKLKLKANWRVQYLTLTPPTPFDWED